MIEFVQWCSVFCTGQQAQGEITIEFESGPVSLPICDDCLRTLSENPQRMLELEPGVLLELDPQEEALRLTPTD